MVRAAAWALAVVGLPAVVSAVPAQFPYDAPEKRQGYAPPVNRSQAVIDVFKLSWEAYYEHAFPNDELHPVTNTSGNSRNGWAASAADALSTALIMGEREIVNQIISHIPSIDWSSTSDPVSLFETTIRYLGGMLSGYDFLSGPLAHLADNPAHVAALLTQSIHLANNLSFAFNTPSGIPYNTLHLATRPPAWRTALHTAATSAAFSSPQPLHSTMSDRAHHDGSAGRAYTVEQKAAVLRIKRCAPTAYYEILGLEEVKKTCTDGEIKKAYRKLSLLTHPDKNGYAGADEAFKLVSKAFQVLSDPDKKTKFDQFGGDPDARFNPASAGAGGSPFSGFAGQRGGGFQEEMTPEELFRQFFGGGFGAPFGRRLRHRAGLRVQPRRRSRRTGTSIWRRTTAEKTRDCAASGAGRDAGHWERAGESAATAVPLCAASSFVALFRWVLEFRSVVCFPATARVHMSAQVERSVWRQLLRLALGVQRVRQQPKRQEVEGTGQAGRDVIRACSGRQVQPRAVRATKEDARRARVVLRRRRSHGTGEEHEHAQLQTAIKAWPGSTLLDGRSCLSGYFGFCIQRSTTSRPAVRSLSTTLKWMPVLKLSVFFALHPAVMYTQLSTWLAVSAALWPTVAAFYPYQYDDGSTTASSRRRSARVLKSEASITLPLRRVPASLRSRQQNTYNIVDSKDPAQENSVAIDQDGSDLSYMVAVSIGDSKEEYHLLLDSAASNTWVMGQDCKSDACGTHTTFGTGDSSTLKTRPSA
ncbi:hypothetical protein OPT61_g9490 [Boeremia exigua]|uniref:Uncharacterized protein n=1 Tax=Boeremia exigua TaxID=749465 RepID=A0ACC2HUW3_9PLEO|nr:hypothetical protein OPT61_g9490 [Boeremia exigua]